MPVINPNITWLDSNKELIELINWQLTLSGAEKVRKSEMLSRCSPNFFVCAKCVRKEFTLRMYKLLTQIFMDKRFCTAVTGQTA